MSPKKRRKKNNKSTLRGLHIHVHNQYMFFVWAKGLCFNSIFKSGGQFFHGKAFTLVHGFPHYPQCCSSTLLIVVQSDLMLDFIWTGKSEFLSPLVKISTETRLIYFQLVKSERPHQPRLQNPRWLLGTSMLRESCNNTVYQRVGLICVSLNQSYTQYCPTCFCGPMVMVFVCAKHHVMHCYQLVLLTTANLAKNFLLTCC